jgi:hypothetical protein
MWGQPPRLSSERSQARQGVTQEAKRILQAGIKRSKIAEAYASVPTRT